MFSLLPDDILSYIFTFLNPNSLYFLIDKKLYQLRKRYLLLYQNSIKVYDKNRKYWLINLISSKYYKLSKDLGKYRERILYFISDEDKKSFIYPCQNSYHRMLVHQFCDAQELSHQTIINDYRTIKVCEHCNSGNIRFDKYQNNKEECRCKNCWKNFGYMDAIWRKVKIIDIPVKAIKISKI